MYFYCVMSVLFSFSHGESFMCSGMEEQFVLLGGDVINCLFVFFYCFIFSVLLNFVCLLISGLLLIFWPFCWGYARILVCVCMFLWWGGMCVLVYIHVHIYAYRCTCMFVCPCVRICVFVFLCMFMWMCLYVRAPICVLVFIYFSFFAFLYLVFVFCVL